VGLRISRALGKFALLSLAEILLVALGMAAFAACLVVFFAVATEGRYFGASLSHWTYDRIGPSIFRLQSEAGQWQTLARYLHLIEGERLLDVGTALGDLPISFAQIDFAGVRAYGLERSPTMVAAAARDSARRGTRDRVSFVLADANSPLPFAAEAFSVVTALGILEGLGEPDRVLAEIVRVLEPDGKVVVSVYQGASSLVVSLSEQWYRARLLDFTLERRNLRKSHDILIASR
jgi:ubiquinone/menaquinone biosynthesis C-methylase UbiE